MSGHPAHRRYEERAATVSPKELPQSVVHPDPDFVVPRMVDM